jgi:hypothetical protein
VNSFFSPGKARAKIRKKRLRAAFILFFIDSYIFYRFCRQMTNNSEERRETKCKEKKGTGKEKRGQATFFLKSCLSPFFLFT